MRHWLELKIFYYARRMRLQTQVIQESHKTNTVIDYLSQWSMQLSSHFTKILTAKCCFRLNNQNQVSRKECNKLRNTFFFCEFHKLDLWHNVFQSRQIQSFMCVYGWHCAPKCQTFAQPVYLLWMQDSTTCQVIMKLLCVHGNHHKVLTISFHKACHIWQSDYQRLSS